METLKDLVERDDVPHATMFHGPSGCGKTTLARLLAVKLECGPVDLKELNAASCRGVDDIRAIERQMHSAPLAGKIRAWILDEAHKLTSDAQNALLKVLEDPADHAYFMLCTTLPHKLIKTIQNRCMQFQLRLLNDDEIKQVVQVVAEKESITLDKKVLAGIIKYSMGSARAALVMLQAIRGVKSVEKQLQTITAPTMETEAFKLIQMLLWERASWDKVCKFLQTFEEDPEGFRRFILVMASRELKKNNPKTKDRAYVVINAFRDHYFDSGEAGLISSCYEVVTGK